MHTRHAQHVAGTSIASTAVDTGVWLALVWLEWLALAWLARDGHDCSTGKQVHFHVPLLTIDSYGLVASHGRFSIPPAYLLAGLCLRGSSTNWGVQLCTWPYRIMKPCLQTQQRQQHAYKLSSPHQHVKTVGTSLEPEGICTTPSS